MSKRKCICRSIASISYLNNKHFVLGVPCIITVACNANPLESLLSTGVRLQMIMLECYPTKASGAEELREIVALWQWLQEMLDNTYGQERNVGQLAYTMWPSYMLPVLTPGVSTPEIHKGPRFMVFIRLR